MRFIIRELTHETPLAAGQLRYERDGQATGAVEQWRLTAAPDDYRFLRVDLDARDARSGHSYLYHLVLNQHGRPERLSYRFWGSGLQVTGNVLLEDEALTATRRVNGQRYEESIPFPEFCTFWFPSSVGLGLLANCPQGGDPPLNDQVMTVILEAVSDGGLETAESAFSLKSLDVMLTMKAGEIIDIMNNEVMVRPLLVCWQDQERILWLDENNWPVKMRRGDGLTAVETRYLRYA
jgi:hypothetical protein